MTKRDRALSLLYDVSIHPTAPFHEHLVAAHIRRHLESLGLHVASDRFGNLTAFIRRGDPAQGVVLVAHMDHPGVEVTRVLDHEVMASVLGGISAHVMAPETPFVLHDGPTTVSACLLEYVEGSSGVRAQVRLRASDVRVGAFGSFAIEPVVQVGSLLALRAADDLAQCAALLAVAERLAASADPVDVTLLFTRAEEVGFAGATLAAANESVAKSALLLSLECSAALPGAAIGFGTVIRTGDRELSFHPEVEEVLMRTRDIMIESARSRGERAPNIQRQLMTGGRCEATAFGAFGYKVGGVCLPLGNYHNADDDHHVAPEYIHIQDYLDNIEFVLAVVGEVAMPHPHRAKPWIEAANRLAYRLTETRT